MTKLMDTAEFVISAPMIKAAEIMGAIALQILSLGFSLYSAVAGACGVAYACLVITRRSRPHSEITQTYKMERLR